MMKMAKICLPFGRAVKTEEELIFYVFPNFLTKYTNTTWLSERAILAPKNIAVHKTNTIMLDMLPAERMTYESLDKIIDEAQVVNYLTEFLHSLEPPGFSPHKLILKANVPIMLLRNLDPPKLCNGTCLLCHRLLPHVIEAIVMAGKYAGESVFIPRIPLIPNGDDLPVEWKKLQFQVG